MSDPVVADDVKPDVDVADEFSLGDFSGKKKKRKPKVAVEAEPKIEEETALAPAAISAAPIEVGVLAAGESEDRDYNYTEMLERVFSLLHEKNPNLSVRKRHVMPPPQLVRVGTRKTMWANFAQICQLSGDERHMRTRDASDAVRKWRPDWMDRIDCYRPTRHALR